MGITDERIKTYLDSLYTPLDSELEKLRAAGESNHVPIIFRDTEEMLRSLMVMRQPERILEIGCAIGYSASVFAKACNCRVTTVEADENMYKMACDNIKMLGLTDKINVMYGDARDVLVKLRETCSEQFDMVFIDAAKSHYRSFWDLSLPLCKTKALIICDNVLMKGMTASDDFDVKRRYKTSIKKMRDFAEYIKEQSYADTCILPVGDGMSVSIIDKEKV